MKTICINKKDLAFIEEIKYGENDGLEKKISEINDPYILHVIAATYNWDDGLEIPLSIIDNEQCDLGTALMMFFNADGLLLLMSELNNFLEQKEWCRFVTYLYDKIVEDKFISSTIAYVPEISNVQKYKIKKKNSLIPNVFFRGNSGIEVKIPSL